MAPTPLPTPDPTVPVLDTSLSAKTIAASIPKLYLGQNTVVADSNNGFQTTLPMTTSNLMYASGYRVASGSTYDYFNSDNFKIDSLGAFTSKATGSNSLAGSLSVTGALSVTGVSTLGVVNSGAVSSSGLVTANGGFTTTNGAFTTTNGDLTTTAGKVSAKDLKTTSANLQIDSTSATNTITLNGALKVNPDATGASVFKLNSTTGEIQTYGNISTTGSGTITAGGALSGAALNIGTLFKVDGFGAMTVKDAAATQAIYSFDKNGNFFTSGSLTAPGTATLATGKFVVDGASGNLATQGTISSGNVAVSGTLKTTGVVNIGGTDASPAIQLSNNGTSYFKNSVQIGDATSQKSILNADGTASFATGNFTVAATGDVVAKGTASFGNNAVALGFAQGAMPANAKVSVDSAGNVAAAGTLAVAGNSTLTGTLGVASNKLTVNASGDLATTGVLSVSSGKLTADANGNVVAAGTLQAASNKFNVNASGDVSTTGKLAVTGDSTLTGKLDVTGNSTFAGTLAATGAVTAASTLRVTGATTLSSTLAVAGDLAVNTDKFKVTASSGDATMLGNLTVGGNANFSGNQIQLNTDGSVFAKNYIKTDYAFSNYVKSAASDDLLTAVVPAVNSVADQALFNSSTNKYLTTQEYVDRAVFKQAARLNLITKDVDSNLATFNNFSKVLAAIEGSSAATIMNGLVDSVDDIKISVSDLMGGGYNSIVISCVPSVWGDAAAPEPIPTPISNLYKEDGWFYSNLASNSKINWYLPSYSGMKMKDITNLYMNNFLLSTFQLPKITIYTSPKNNSTDSMSGVYNAKIEYYFTAPTPAAVTAQKSALYIIDSPKNVYSDKSNDMKSGYSKTIQGSSSVTTPITTSTLFSNSFDTSKVLSEDTILTFAIETNESTIKDYMFILQNFNISTRTGTTQMLFQNVSVVNDYLFKYFFRQHPDFSDAVNSNNAVDKSNYDSYVSNIVNNSMVSLPSSSNVSPQSHNTNFTLTIGGQSVTSDNQTLIFGSSTITNVPIICNLVNKNDSVTIKHGSTTILNGVVGDYNGTRNLTVGDNNFVVTVKDPANDHSTIINCTVHVKSSDASLKTILVNTTSTSNNSTVNLPAGTANATIYVTTNAALVNSCKVVGGTTASTELVANGVVRQNGLVISGLVTGINEIKITSKSEDLSPEVETKIYLKVLSRDTSLSNFTVAGQNALIDATINLSSSFIEKTIADLNIQRTPTASTTTLTPVSLVGGRSTLQLGSNKIEFVATAEDTTPLRYERTLYVKSSEGRLSSVTINSVEKQLTGTPDFILASNTTSLNVVAIPVANGKATVTISGQVTGLTPGMTTTITIAVQPEDTSIAPTNYSYGVHILSNDANVDAVYINDNQLTIAADNTASVTVKNLVPPSSFSFKAVESTTTSSLKYKMESDGQPVNIVSGATNNNIGITPGGVNHLIITDTAENGDHKDTTITISSLSTDITLSEFKATYGGNTYNVTSGQTITLATGVNEVVVEARSSYSGAEVTLDGVIGIGYSNKTISVPAGTTKEVLVNVKATDGTTTTNPYKVTFVAPASAPDTSLSGATITNTKTGVTQPLDFNTTYDMHSQTDIVNGFYNYIINLTPTSKNTTITSNDNSNFIPYHTSYVLNSSNNQYQFKLPVSGGMMNYPLYGLFMPSALNYNKPNVVLARDFVITSGGISETRTLKFNFINDEYVAPAPAPALSNDTSLSKITVSPSGAPRTIDVSIGGTVTLPYDGININNNKFFTVIAKAGYSGSSIKIDGVSGINNGGGVFTRLFEIRRPTSKTISIEVTAEDGRTTASYSILVEAPVLDASIDSLGWFDGDNAGSIENPRTTEQVTLTQGATFFNIYIYNLINVPTNTISAKVDGVDVICNSTGIQNDVSITPGQTVSVVMTVRSDNGTTASCTVNVTSP